MKHLLTVAALGTALTVQSFASKPAIAATLFQAILNSDQEVPPAGDTNSPATGFATLELLETAPDTFSLAYDLTVSSELDFGLVNSGVSADEILATGEENDVTQLHIHNAPRGVNGPVVYGIFNPDQDFNDNVDVVFNSDGSTTISGSWDLGDGGTPLSNFVDELLAAAPGEDVPLYWNVHTVGDPAGAIRGQIFAVAAPEPLSVPEPSSLLGLALFGGTSLLFQRRKQSADQDHKTQA